MGEDAAFEKRLELALDELRQTRLGVRFDLGENRLMFFGHHLQLRVLGAVARRIEGRRASPP